MTAELVILCTHIVDYIILNNVTNVHNVLARGSKIPIFNVPASSSQDKVFDKSAICLISPRTY